MSVVIRTDRLDLRSLDGDAAAAVLEGRSPARLDWIVGYPFASTVDAARRTLDAEADRTHWSPFARFQIVLRRTAQVIGDCGFEAPPDSDGAVVVSYEMAEAARGRGFEAEALEALIGFAFTRDEVTCVRASTAVDDERVRRVYENAGMMSVGEHDGRAHFEA